LGTDFNYAMQRQARRILLASLIALHGVVTVGAPALHALYGAEHVKAGAPGDGGGSDHPTSLHHDCPICHFLAQAQFSVDSQHFLSMDVVRIKPADDLPLTFPAVFDRPSGPRAPPLA
jgi:hypothetical protein